jgi:hypothetical protein
MVLSMLADDIDWIEYGLVSEWSCQCWRRYCWIVGLVVSMELSMLVEILLDCLIYDALNGNVSVGGSVTASEFIVTGANEFVIEDLSVNNALKVGGNVSIHKSLYVGDDSVGVRKDAKLQITGGNLIVEENSVFTTDAMVEYPRAAYVDVSAGTKYTADNEFSTVVLKNGDILKLGTGTQAWRSSDGGNTWFALPNMPFGLTVCTIERSCNE